MADIGVEIDKEKTRQSSHVENQKKGKKTKKNNNEENSSVEPYIPTATTTSRF